MSKNKFSFAQMVSNSDGKTSGSGTMGCLVVIVGCIGFLSGILNVILGDGDGQIMMYSTGFIGAGVTLLGVRKTRDSTVDSVFAGPDEYAASEDEMLNS